ncbi:MAG: hypothetical protein HS123_00480 [Solibacteraceae bacterium]|nr:hypothetical protein [Solibacteraceae bacterium]
MSSSSTCSPRLEAELGTLSPNSNSSAPSSTSSLESALHARCAPTYRPARDRTALATAFLAKAVLNLPTTRQLIDRLKTDSPSAASAAGTAPTAPPHESKFSRAFALFAHPSCPSNPRRPHRLHPERPPHRTHRSRFHRHRSPRTRPRSPP